MRHPRRPPRGSKGREIYDRLMAVNRNLRGAVRDVVALQQADALTDDVAQGFRELLSEALEPLTAIHERLVRKGNEAG
jgi:uncharacterized protein YfdQ (DUF2303 family)